MYLVTHVILLMKVELSILTQILLHICELELELEMAPKFIWLALHSQI